MPTMTALRDDGVRVLRVPGALGTYARFFHLIRWLSVGP
jgi:hypothetical protein